MTSLLPYKGTNRLFDKMRHEMDELFQRFGSPFALATPSNGLDIWEPHVDVEETDKALLVKVDLPGVDAKDIDISAQDNVLTVKGERKEEKTEKGKSFHRTERFVGSFYRAIPLPAGTDAEGITATSAKGVITVTVPKKPGTQPKKIAVKDKE